jgi:two-component system phosphate regulon response regulator PhoB
MSNIDAGKILIIEDDASFRRLYRDMLSAVGYYVSVADDGEMGWQMVHSVKPDLILLDLVLPKMHGFEVLKNIRGDSETKDIPVIIMTALGEQEDIHKGLELGANDYMVKGSFTSREILAKIRVVFSSVKAKENIKTYKLFMKDARGDTTFLQVDLGVTSMFTCPQCREEIVLNLITDYTKTDSHWFSAHFVCPKCNKSF